MDAEITDLMTQFHVTFKVGGGLPDLGTNSLSIGASIELVKETSAWKIRSKVDAPTEAEAFQKAKDIASFAIAIFQVFMIRSSSSFRIFLEDKDFEVKNLATGLPVPLPIVGSLFVSAFVSSPELMGKVSSDINGVSSFALVDEDCRFILHYFSTAMKEPGNLYKFLNYITSIEAMLSDRGEITEKISRRLAVLLSSKLPDMQKTYENFKRLYRKRSDTLHGIDISDVSAKDVSLAEDYARIAVRSFLVLRREFNRQQINERLDDFFDGANIAEIRTKTAII